MWLLCHDQRPAFPTTGHFIGIKQTHIRSEMPEKRTQARVRLASRFPGYALTVSQEVAQAIVIGDTK